MNFLRPQISKPFIVVNVVLGLGYFLAILFFFPVGTRWLFVVFITGEVFRLWQLLTYLFTIWETEYRAAFKSNFSPDVDVFITVAGESVEIVEETAQAALAMQYSGNHFVYLLNDGYVVQSENWREIKLLGKKLGIKCITRRKPGGAKAGNINHALLHTRSPYIAIFDADHVPHADFLQKTIGFFGDRKMGFVQTPQFYKNHTLNAVTQGAWEQQELFFGPIMKGKNRMNAAFLCGTNMVLRRQALNEAGGMCETNIAEDFLTSLFIHERGWKSFYLDEVLAEGLAPEDLLTYHKQQFRWARGSLEVIFKYNPLLRSGLSVPQKIHYLASSSFYLSGLVMLMNMLLPLLFLFFGIVVFDISTMSLAAIFFPYIMITLYVLSLSSNSTFTFHALAFTASSFHIHLKALHAVVTQKNSKFIVTSKTKIEGNFLSLVLPHMLYIGAVIIGILFSLTRQGISSSLITNISWASVSIISMLPFIRAAFPPAFFRSLPQSYITTRIAALRVNKVDI